jgi:tetratricopeptide (TPR) repeat protein
VAADRALAIDPELGEALATKAYVLMLKDWNWSAADSVFRLATARSPRYATALKWHADLLEVMEHREEALAALMRARDLDPLSPIIYYNIAFSLAASGRLTESVAAVEKGLELDSLLPPALDLASRLYLEQGDTAKYFAARSRLDAVSRFAGARVDVLRRAYATGGREGIWRAQLADPATQDLPFDRAVWYARLGENDAAFRELERAYAMRSIWMPYINESVWFRKAFRADPRFRALRQRMRLPESTSRDF